MANKFGASPERQLAMIDDVNRLWSFVLLIVLNLCQVMGEIAALQAGTFSNFQNEEAISTTGLGRGSVNTNQSYYRWQSDASAHA